MERPYDQLAATLSPRDDRVAAMRDFVDHAWKHLGSCGVSWIGFYLPAGEEEMVLGPSRNKPACSPIGMHGACGRALRERRPLVVRDVAALGGGYIACDPRDRSELVIPLFEPDGACWGVLDVDSYDPAAFDEHDVRELVRLLRTADLTADHERLAAVLVV